MKLLLLAFLLVQAVFSSHIQGDVDLNAEVSVEGKPSLSERLATLKTRIETLEENRDRILERVNKSPELVSRLEALVERLSTAAAKLGQYDRLNQLDATSQRPPRPQLVPSTLPVLPHSRPQVSPARPQVSPVRPQVSPARPQVPPMRPPVMPQVVPTPTTRPQVAAEVSVDQVGAARIEY